MTQHGGTVSAESAGRGRGAAFTVRLPQLVDRAHPAPATGQTGKPQLPNGRRVLVVDDNHDAAVMLVEVLARLGYQARAAHDGPSALDVAREFEPDVALVDIGLPVMDGYELGGRLTEGSRDIRLIALTGYGLTRDVLLSAAAGFAAHLVKPVDAELLRVTIAAVLEVPRPDATA